MTFTYTPDDDVKVHEEGAIRLICAAFQSHENGLPEWLKNASDAYVAAGVPLERRVMVLILETGRKGNEPSISCLDFVGMTSKTIEEDFRIWADPDAASRRGQATSVQGGHGNGGKCYMTQMFDGGSVLVTVKDGHGCRYGVAPASVKFGYVPDRAQGRDFPIGDLDKALRSALAEVHCQPQRLPKPARELLANLTGFTLITGFSPKGYASRIPVSQLAGSLEEHPQMLKTLELGHVYVMVNGDVWEEGRRLELPAIPPLEGGEEPKHIAIPAVVTDPQTGSQVPTFTSPNSSPGEIVFRTSSTSMRWSKKYRHVVLYVARGDYVGYTPVGNLDVQSPYRDRIYGECRLDIVARVKQNDRGLLADSPLKRALEHFLSQEMQVYAKQFEIRERRRYDQEERTALSKMNEALDRWKNRFLREMLQGLWGPGTGGPKPTRERLPAGKAHRLEVRLTHAKAGLGVAFKPSIHFYDIDGREIRAVPFRWMSDNNNVAMVDDDLMVVTTFSHGHTEIWAETLDRRLSSPKVPLDVVHILDIRVEPAEIEIPVGGRQRLEAKCRTSDGDLQGGVYLVWTEGDPKVARVSSSGSVFGFAPGSAEIVAGDDGCLSAKPATVRVIATTGKGKGPGAGLSGYPVIRISSVDLDPDTGETINLSKEYPPVYQGPQDVDRNVWWINSSAPFAALYLNKERGYGYNSREWRIYHLERFTEIMVQIALTNGPSERESVSINDWIIRSGQHAAEIQSAAVAGLHDFIAAGVLPEEPS